MPFAAARIMPCGCRVEHGGNCAHMLMRKRHRQRTLDRQRGSAASRGYDADWQRLSKAYLAEPGNRRCRCGAPAVLVAHVISIKQRPDLRLDRSNWRPSCQACNLRQNIYHEGGFGRRPTGGGSKVSGNAS